MKVNVKRFKEKLFSGDNVKRMLNSVEERYGEEALYWTVEKWEEDVFGDIGYHGTFMTELLEDNKEYFKEYIASYSDNDDDRTDDFGYYQAFYELEGDIEPFNTKEPAEFFEVIKELATYLKDQYPTYRHNLYNPTLELDKPMLLQKVDIEIHQLYTHLKQSGFFTKDDISTLLIDAVKCEAGKH